MTARAGGPRFRRLVLTCEHGGNDVPARWRPLFADAAAALGSHRGMDFGALELARLLARTTGAPLVAATTTRLLVDLNRSPHHRALFSAWTRPLPAAERERILARHYRPHRERVEREVATAIARGAPALHLAVHSFTPVLDGATREVDVGLLYDPARPLEREAARVFRAALAARLPALRIRMNRPYRGTADGLTTALRRRFAARAYAGIELEVNQRFPLGDAAAWRAVKAAVATALTDVLG